MAGSVNSSHTLNKDTCGAAVATVRSNFHDDQGFSMFGEATAASKLI